jgi:hypothetical protein
MEQFNATPPLRHRRLIPYSLPRVAQHAQHHFLQPALQGGGDVLVVLAQRRDVVFAPRTEDLDEPVGHPFVALVVVRHPLGIHRDAVFPVEVDDVLEERVVAPALPRHDVVGVAVARQRHDDALVVDVLPAQVAGDRGIDQAQRVRIVVFLVHHLDRPVAPDAQLHRLVVADPVDAQQDRLLESAGIIGAGQMRQMVVEEA